MSKSTLLSRIDTKLSKHKNEEDPDPKRRKNIDDFKSWTKFR